MALPRDLQEQMQATISIFFEQAWAALRAGVDDPTDVEEIVRATACEAVTSAARLKYESIAQDARERNARMSWLSRLPNEVWHHVWGLLPFADCLSATHVCVDWRASMRAMPHLWTNLHLYTYNAQPALTPGIGAIPDILALSKHLPLDVTVEDSNNSDYSACIALARRLNPQAPRIVRLCVRSPNVDTPRHMLSTFAVLPALLEFVADRVPPFERKSSGVESDPFLPRNVELPVLERVQRGLGFRWPRDDRRLPSVRVLELTPTVNAMAELRTALTGCPRLTTLRLDLRAPDRAFKSSDMLSDADVPKTLRSITAVSVRSAVAGWLVYSMWGPWGVGTGVAERVIQYDDCAGQPLTRCATFFDLVRWCSRAIDRVDVCMTYNVQRRFSIRAVASGRVRQASYNMCADPTPEIKCILEELSRTKVKVVADASLRGILSRLASSSVEIEFIPDGAVPS